MKGLIDIPHELKIDPEFKSLIPPLSTEEYTQLEESLLRSGYDVSRGKIATWNGTIIEGHHRYELCRKHGIEFKTLEKTFADRTEARWQLTKNDTRTKT